MKPEPGDPMRWWRRWLNPKPLSREWWISWVTALVVFATILLGIVIYASLNPEWLERFEKRSP